MFGGPFFEGFGKIFTMGEDLKFGVISQKFAKIPKNENFLGKFSFFATRKIRNQK